jgi:hypothetical protein
MTPRSPPASTGAGALKMAYSLPTHGREGDTGEYCSCVGGVGFGRGAAGGSDRGPRDGGKRGGGDLLLTDVDCEGGLVMITTQSGGQTSRYGCASDLPPRQDLCPMGRRKDQYLREGRLHPYHERQSLCRGACARCRSPAREACAGVSMRGLRLFATLLCLLLAAPSGAASFYGPYRDEIVPFGCSTRTWHPLARLRGVLVGIFPRRGNPCEAFPDPLWPLA